MFSNLKRQKWIILDRFQLWKQIKINQPSKIIVGSGSVKHDGWLCTDYPVFDITSTLQWSILFKKSTLSNILAEHVFEHLTECQIGKVLRLAYYYLKMNGIFHISIPDGNHPNKKYIDYVRPGGFGPGADNHKILWNYKKIIKVSRNAGFKVKLIEYCDDNGNIFASKYNDVPLPFRRSISKGYSCDIKNYSSLIVDLTKN